MNFTKLLSRTLKIKYREIINLDKIKKLEKNLVLRITALVLFMAISSAIMVAAISNVRLVTVNYVDLDEKKTVRTFENDIDVILKDLKLSNMALGAVEVTEHEENYTKINVYRSFSVSLTVDAKTVSFEVARGTVADLLKLAEVTVHEFDILSHQLTDALSADMQIVIKRVVYKTVTEDENTAFETKYIPLLSIPKGKEVISQKGIFGLSRVTKRLMYIDDVLSGAEILSREVISKPVNQIVSYGTGGKFFTKEGEHFDFLYCLDVKATAYTYRDPSKPWQDRTATGLQAAVGRIAVDPKVIPYGSKLFITYPDGRTCYGYAVAADTGGGMKGNRIDLFYETRQECLNFGRRNVKVYVISTP